MFPFYTIIFLFLLLHKYFSTFSKFFILSFFSFSKSLCLFTFLSISLFSLSLMFTLFLLLYKHSLSFSYSINHSFILWGILFCFYLCPSKDSSSLSTADLYFSFYSDYGVFHPNSVFFFLCFLFLFWFCSFFFDPAINCRFSLIPITFLSRHILVIPSIISFYFFAAFSSAPFLMTLISSFRAFLPSCFPTVLYLHKSSHFFFFCIWLSLFLH